MAQYYRQLPYGGIPIFSSVAAFPLTAFVGAQAISSATDTIYIFNGTNWIAVATPGAAIALDGLTGDVIASGPGVAPATVAAIQGNEISGTTGTGEVVFSASPQLTGNVGIGTTGTPIPTLQVNGAAAIGYAGTVSPPSAGLQVAGDIVLDAGSSSTSSPRAISFTGVSPGAAIQLQLPDPSTGLQIEDNGKLLMYSYWGTEIHGHTQASSIPYVIGGLNDASVSIFGAVGDDAPILQLLDNAGDQAMVTFAGNGNVGIAVDVPQFQLDVAGDAQISGRLRLGDGIVSSSDNNTGIIWPTTNELSFYVHGVAQLNILDGGNVGIDTTTPQTTLQVQGVISPATDNTYTLGTPIYRFTTVYATTGTINTSDEREKEDMKPSPLGLDFINKLNPISYRFKDNSQTHYGLSAQHTEKVMSECGVHTAIVRYDQEYDKYGIAYSELIAPLIKSVQELSHQLELANREICSLKGRG